MTYLTSSEYMFMRVESEERELGVFLYKVDLSENEIKEIEDRVIDLWRKNANIPGYRKGMVPVEILRQRYSQEIYEAFEDTLEEIVISEAVKLHPYSVDKATIIGRFKDRSNNIIKIPGQTDNNTFSFLVKVSSQTSLIPTNEIGLVEKIKNINFVLYNLDTDTIDFDELTNLFFSPKRVEKYIDGKNLKNYIVEMLIEIEENSVYISIILPLEIFPDTAKYLESKKLSQDLEIPLENKLKKILQNYYSSMYDEPLKLENRIRIRLSRIFVLDKSKDVIEKSVKLVSEDPSVIRSLLSKGLNDALDSFNHFRVISKVVQTVTKGSKIHISETEYLSELLKYISVSLLEHKNLPVHISHAGIDLNSYLVRSLEKMIVKNVIKFIHKTFIGNISKIDDRNYEEVYSKVYQKLLEVCSVNNKNISYQELKEELPFLLYEFILDR